MANIVKFLRSAIAGRIPTAVQLAAAQIGFNTTDKKMFFGTGSEVIELRNKTVLLNGMDSYLYGTTYISNAGLAPAFGLNSASAKDVYLNYVDGMSSDTAGFFTPGKMLVRRVAVGLSAICTSDTTFEIYVNKVLKEAKILPTGSDREVFSSSLLLNSRDMVSVRVSSNNPVPHPVCNLDIAYRD